MYLWFLSPSQTTVTSGIIFTKIQRTILFFFAVVILFFPCIGYAPILKKCVDAGRAFS